MTRCRHLLAAITLVSPLVVAPPVAAQAPPNDGWNDPRVVELVQRSIQRRMIEVVDTALQNYSAEARGYVYFLLDAPELDRQTLVRTDQVAVEMYWRAPNEVRQRIVGLRERRELPVTRLYYYLDRMTLVQDNYGQAIVIADGDNVNDVPHPIGQQAEEFYDYRLADSLTLRLPGVENPVRVQQVQVRPRNSDLPAVVGSIFLEAATDALVRMNFTFTPAAYVDPRLDHINVTLENGLWRGRYWLPYEQRLEIRREIPELDLPFGTVIRTRMRVGEYRFNEGVPEWLFQSRLPITMAPREQRESFEFEQPIDAELRLEGIGQPLEADEARREARSIAQEQMMSGLPQTRLGFGSASDIFRYNRAEGLAIGFGWAFRPREEMIARLHAGWAFGAEHPVFDAEFASQGESDATFHGYVNRPRDVGGTEPAAGVTNTVAALVLGEDWLDTYYSSGVAGSVTLWTGGPWSVVGSASLQRQRSAELTTTFSLFEGSDPFRQVRQIDAGDLVSGELVLGRNDESIVGDWWAELRGGGGRLAGDDQTFAFANLEADGGVRRTWSAYRSALDVRAAGGAILGNVLRQELFLIGGRGTLPGFAHRSFGGDRYILLTTEGSADLAHPWLRARTSAGFGWTGTSERGMEAVEKWGASPSDGIKPFVGVGIGVFYDLLHLNIARGFGNGARTQFIVEVQRPFWDFL